MEDAGPVSCEAERSAWEGLPPRPRASGVARSHSQDKHKDR